MQPSSSEREGVATPWRTKSSSGGTGRSQSTPSISGTQQRHQRTCTPIIAEDPPVKQALCQGNPSTLTSAAGGLHQQAAPLLTPSAYGSASGLTTARENDPLGANSFSSGVSNSAAAKCAEPFGRLVSKLRLKIQSFNRHEQPASAAAPPAATNNSAVVPPLESGMQAAQLAAAASADPPLATAADVCQPVAAAPGQGQQGSQDVPLPLADPQTAAKEALVDFDIGAFGFLGEQRQRPAKPAPAVKPRAPIFGRANRASLATSWDANSASLSTSSAQQQQQQQQQLQVLVPNSRGAGQDCKAAAASGSTLVGLRPTRVQPGHPAAQKHIPALGIGDQAEQGHQAEASGVWTAAVAKMQMPALGIGGTHRGGWVAGRSSRLSNSSHDQRAHASGSDGPTSSGSPGKPAVHSSLQHPEQNGHDLGSDHPTSTAPAIKPAVNSKPGQPMQTGHGLMSDGPTSSASAGKPAASQPQPAAQLAHSASKSVVSHTPAIPQMMDSAGRSAVSQQQAAPQLAEPAGKAAVSHEQPASLLDAAFGMDSFDLFGIDLLGEGQTAAQTPAARPPATAPAPRRPVFGRPTSVTSSSMAVPSASARGAPAAGQAAAGFAARRPLFATVCAAVAAAGSKAGPDLSSDGIFRKAGPAYSQAAPTNATTAATFGSGSGQPAAVASRPRPVFGLKPPPQQAQQAQHAAGRLARQTWKIPFSAPRIVAPAPSAPEAPPVTQPSSAGDVASFDAGLTAQGGAFAHHCPSMLPKSGAVEVSQATAGKTACPDPPAGKSCQEPPQQGMAGAVANRKAGAAGRPVAPLGAGAEPGGHAVAAAACKAGTAADPPAGVQAAEVADAQDAKPPGMIEQLPANAPGMPGQQATRVAEDYTAAKYRAASLTAEASDAFRAGQEAPLQTDQAIAASIIAMTLPPKQPYDEPNKAAPLLRKQPLAATNNDVFLPRNQLCAESSADLHTPAMTALPGRLQRGSRKTKSAATARASARKVQPLFADDEDMTYRTPEQIAADRLQAEEEAEEAEDAELLSFGLGSACSRQAAPARPAPAGSSTPASALPAASCPIAGASRLAQAALPAGAGPEERALSKRAGASDAHIGNAPIEVDGESSDADDLPVMARKRMQRQLSATAVAGTTAAAAAGGGRPNAQQQQRQMVHPTSAEEALALDRSADMGEGQPGGGACRGALMDSRPAAWGNSGRKLKRLCKGGGKEAAPASDDLGMGLAIGLEDDLGDQSERSLKRMRGADNQALLRDQPCLEQHGLPGHPAGEAVAAPLQLVRPRNGRLEQPGNSMHDALEDAEESAGTAQRSSNPFAVQRPGQQSYRHTMPARVQSAEEFPADALRSLLAPTAQHAQRVQHVQHEDYIQPDDQQEYYDDPGPGGYNWQEGRQHHAEHAEHAGYSRHSGYDGGHGDYQQNDSAWPQTHMGDEGGYGGYPHNSGTAAAQPGSHRPTGNAHFGSNCAGDAHLSSSYGGKARAGSRYEGDAHLGSRSYGRHQPSSGRFGPAFKAGLGGAGPSGRTYQPPPRARAAPTHDSAAPAAEPDVIDLSEDGPQLPPRHQPAVHHSVERLRAQDDPGSASAGAVGADAGGGEEPWWMRFPDFVPISALGNGTNPRDGSTVHVDYKRQFSGLPAPRAAGGSRAAATPRGGSGLGPGSAPRSRAKQGQNGGAGPGPGSQEGAGPPGTAAEGHWITEYRGNGTAQKVFVTAGGVKLKGKEAYAASKGKAVVPKVRGGKKRKQRSFRRRR